MVSSPHFRSQSRPSRSHDILVSVSWEVVSRSLIAVVDSYILIKLFSQHVKVNTKFLCIWLTINLASNLAVFSSDMLAKHLWHPFHFLFVPDWSRSHNFWSLSHKTCLV